MRIGGIISEYNPFHNGHALQIERVREACDGVICVMSGNFVQRGDVAVFDKFTRAHAAILGGADLVLELPTAYASATAERFAAGAISILDACGIVTDLYFGAESADTASLLSAGKLLAQEPPAVSEKLRTLLSAGLSFPAAREEAYAGLIPKNLLSEPNHLLGLEYCRALTLQKSTIRPHALPRIGAGHHDTSPNGNIASATHLRNLLTAGESIERFVPKACSPLYEKAEIRELIYLERALLAGLRTASPTALTMLPDVSEGLENRILQAAKSATSLSELLTRCQTKRYPKTRICRIFTAFLLGTDKNLQKTAPAYLRILAANRRGRALLAEMKHHASLPLITKTADASSSPLLALDLRASDLAALCQKHIQKGGADFTASPVMTEL